MTTEVTTTGRWGSGFLGASVVVLVGFIALAATVIIWTAIDEGTLGFTAILYALWLLSFFVGGGALLFAVLGLIFSRRGRRVRRKADAVALTASIILFATGISGVFVLVRTAWWWW